MILKRYNQLFEADVKDNKGVPSDYIEGVEQKGREQFGYNGPNPMEMREMMEAIHNILRIQDGKEERLTEIGKSIIEEYYGSILDGVKLDIKIVKPNDPEKREMVEKMFDEDDQEEQEEQEPEFESPEIEVPDVFPVDVDEVDKRKILNNLMQGEAQNVHSMMHTKRDEIDAVNSSLLNFYTRLLDINRKFDWMDSANLEEMMKQNPDFANAEEVEWEEDENGEQTPVIKVRCLDLPMLIHETVKDIYELIMANAIPENAEMARKIIEETDSLQNEKEDIKFGPFIAADIRDFFTDYIDRKTNVSLVDIPNLREFIYGYMVELEASKFLELTYAILSDDKDMADDLIKKYDIVEPAIADATGESEEQIEPSYVEEPEELSTMSIDDLIGGPKASDEPLTPPKEEKPEDRSKKLSGMGINKLNYELNKAIDSEDWEYAKEVQAMMQRKGLAD